MIVYFSTDKETEIVIYDIFGKVGKNLIKGNHKEINVSDLKSGIYIVEVTTDNIKEQKDYLLNNFVLKNRKQPESKIDCFFLSNLLK